MSLSRQELDELFDILSRGWDQKFSADDVARLELLVRRHGAAACEHIIEFSSMHVELDSQMASSRAFEHAMAEIRGSAGSGAVEGKKKSVPPRKQTAPWWRGVSRLWAPWPIAALVLLVAIVGRLWLGAMTDDATPQARAETLTIFRPPQTVACVTSVTDAKWAGDGDFAVGSSLKQDQRLELLSGSAQVSMACGADVVLQGACTIRLASDDLVILERGKVTAEVAKWATGFVIEANGLRITDLGTRFAMSADPTGAVEAHVLEGEVLAEPMKEHRPKRSSMLLKSGEAIRVSMAQATIDTFAAQRARFADRIGQFRPFRPIPMWNTGIGQTVGKGDPHWQVTAGDQQFGPYPKPAVITPGDQSYLDNMPDASQWISVKKDAWPGIPTSTTHTFETRFNLTGYDLATVRIVGSFLVDNAINELRINGHPVSFNRWVTTWDVHDFESFHTIEILEGFVPGENVISIDVYNTPSHPDNPEEPNPMGLRVEWQAFGCTLPRSAESD
jgi:hypothetical protein